MGLVAGIVGAAAASVAGAAASAALKPKAPKPGVFDPVNPQDVQRQAIAGNTANLPAIENLAQQSNNFNSAELQRMYELAIPGYNKLKDKSASVIGNFLNGGDITDTLRGSAAENLGRGTAGSQFGVNTSLQRSVSQIQANQLTGLSSLERWMASTKSPQVDISSMFLSPNPQFAASERDKALTYQNAANQYNFVNDPWNQFQTQAADVFGNSLKNYLGGIGPGSTQSNINSWKSSANPNPVWSSGPTTSGNDWSNIN